MSNWNELAKAKLRQRYISDCEGHICPVIWTEKQVSVGEGLRREI